MLRRAAVARNVFTLNATPDLWLTRLTPGLLGVMKHQFVGKAACLGRFHQ
jgi:hypothetical protein